MRLVRFDQKNMDWTGFLILLLLVMIFGCYIDVRQKMLEIRFLKKQIEIHEQTIERFSNKLLELNDNQRVDFEDGSWLERAPNRSSLH